MSQHMSIQTAWDILDTHFGCWRQGLLKACQGHEQASVIELVRALDYLAVTAVFVSPLDDGKTERLFRYALNGFAASMRDLLPKLRAYGDGIPWRPTTDQHSAWAVHTLVQAGEMARARRLAALERYGLTRCTVSSRAIDIEV